ncbi:hypothetical protein MCUN1_001151 [Malassezia cuniculi]|uniref:NADH-ubiquinone oxidoreductase 24 kDa subunit, mitochondrial n=1 Tax=Malassezia cuniculi TaxID=948313 RepID=A0AAF0EX07_9BASI|nr:hypothetical protein MCUN1_001151 [Malassezia cuniculi]
MMSALMRNTVGAIVRGAGARVPRAGVRALTSTAAVRSDALFVHRDTPDNNAEIKFSFNEASMAKAEEIVARYPPQYKKAAVIPLLDLAQRQNNNFTSLSAMNYVAEFLEMPPMRVYEVATFYTMFNRTPVGKYFVQLCTTTPCMLGGCGSDKIVKAVLDHLKIGLGETTSDGLFTVIEVECLGACSNAPMVQINDDYYEDLTPETIVDVLSALARGEKPKAGPQNGRLTSAPHPTERTLTATPYGPGEHCVPEFA